MGIKWEDRWEQLGHLPEHTLYDLVRNQSAPTAFRTTAAEIMVMKGMSKANDPEVQRFLPTTPAPVIHESETYAVNFVQTPKAEPKKIVAEEYSGPLKASVTTTSLHQPEIVPEPVRKVDEKK
jgi:hypothetical protein